MGCYEGGFLWLLLLDSYDKAVNWGFYGIVIMISWPFHYLKSCVVWFRLSCYNFISSFSIQNDNQDASTDTTFKTYPDPSSSPLGDSCDEGEGEPFRDPVSGPTVFAEKGSDLFAPIIVETDSPEEPVLPQVKAITFPIAVLLIFWLQIFNLEKKKFFLSLWKVFILQQRVWEG